MLITSNINVINGSNLSTVTPGCVSPGDCSPVGVAGLSGIPLPLVKTPFGFALCDVGGKVEPTGLVGGGVNPAARRGSYCGLG